MKKAQIFDPSSLYDQSAGHISMLGMQTVGWELCVHVSLWLCVCEALCLVFFSN